MIHLGLDLDETISKAPEFFSFLSKATKNQRGSVHIVSSRSDEPDVRAETLKELAQYKIDFDQLYLLPDKHVAELSCPHTNLDWYQKFIWQKVDYSLRHGITVFFDDEQKVVEVFQKFAPGVQVFRAI